jgi:hypothetical protein
MGKLSDDGGVFPSLGQHSCSSQLGAEGGYVPKPVKIGTSCSNIAYFTACQKNPFYTDVGFFAHPDIGKVKVKGLYREALQVLATAS